jgi:hypothetical protein
MRRTKVIHDSQLTWEGMTFNFQERRRNHTHVHMCRTKVTHDLQLLLGGNLRFTIAGGFSVRTSHTCTAGLSHNFSTFVPSRFPCLGPPSHPTDGPQPSCIPGHNHPHHLLLFLPGCCNYLPFLPGHNSLLFRYFYHVVIPAPSFMPFPLLPTPDSRRNTHSSLSSDDHAGLSSRIGCFGRGFAPHPNKAVGDQVPQKQEGDVGERVLSVQEGWQVRDVLVWCLAVKSSGLDILQVVMFVCEGI